jgi:glycerate 2-kinase
VQWCEAVHDPWSPDGAPGKLLAAPDAFKGTATAAEVAEAVSVGASRAGWDADVCPLSDGGEGFLDVTAGLGGELVTTAVTGPLGDEVEAVWRLAGKLAVVESARASGLILAGGSEGNDPLRATSAGTGELVVRAIEAGAERVIVGVGGSATTDGGWGALGAIDAAGGLKGAGVLVATDVTVCFTDAARVFGPQKGADRAQVAELTERLVRLAEVYRDRGVDVDRLPGGGAAGGLAGGLVVAGARVVPGMDLVARLLDLDARIGSTDLVVTGEGRLDHTSWKGKVVGALCARAAAQRRSVVVVAGQVSSDALDQEDTPEVLEQVADLTACFGADRATVDVAACVALAVERALDPRNRSALSR